MLKIPPLLATKEQHGGCREGTSCVCHLDTWCVGNQVAWSISLGEFREGFLEEMARLLTLGGEIGIIWVPGSRGSSRQGPEASRAEAGKCGTQGVLQRLPEQVQGWGVAPLGLSFRSTPVDKARLWAPPRPPLGQPPSQSGHFSSSSPTSLHHVDTSSRRSCGQ